jgi:uncharacterized cupin superfamily protein
VVEEAKLVETESGLEADSPGWFVVNARDAAWWSHRDTFGYGCPFGSRNFELFPELGITLRVLQPGEPNCRYHAESTQEDFLVLSGEALLLVEEQERPLKAWDFVHCPGGTPHMIVGTGDEPAVVLAVGARGGRTGLRYLVDPVARELGVSVETETTKPAEAYASFPHPTRTSYRDGWLPDF